MFTDISTANYPRKSVEGRYNLRHRSEVRRHGDHYIEAAFVSPRRRAGDEVVVWKIRAKHGATL